MTWNTGDRVRNSRDVEAGDGVWDTGTTPNWQDTRGKLTFSDGDRADFDADDGVATITVSGDVRPSQIGLSGGTWFFNAESDTSGRIIGTDTPNGSELRIFANDLTDGSIERAILNVPVVADVVRHPFYDPDPAEGGLVSLNGQELRGLTVFGTWLSRTQFDDDTTVLGRLVVPQDTDGGDAAIFIIDPSGPGEGVMEVTARLRNLRLVDNAGTVIVGDGTNFNEIESRAFTNGAAGVGKVELKSGGILVGFSELDDDLNLLMSSFTNGGDVMMATGSSISFDNFLNRANGVIEIVADPNGVQASITGRDSAVSNGRIRIGDGARLGFGSGMDMSGAEGVSMQIVLSRDPSGWAEAPVSSAGTTLLGGLLEVLLPDLMRLDELFGRVELISFVPFGFDDPSVSGMFDDIAVVESDGTRTSVLDRLIDDPLAIALDFGTPPSDAIGTIPLPAGGWLMLTGLALLASMRRRRA